MTETPPPYWLPALHPDIVELEDWQDELERAYGHAAVCRCCRGDDDALEQGLLSRYRAAQAAAMSRHCPTCRAAPGRLCRPKASRQSAGPPELRLREHWHASRADDAYTVACPTCAAEARQPCVSPSGRRIGDGPHARRVA